ncbi:MAG: 2Fe-2S iron-sulfur cluster-binding protein, partial [Anaerolineae bacterium]|nr:2Fe-2S iron-sulfur cluster-binding protein [Anaerolineae bacterium]
MRLIVDGQPLDFEAGDTLLVALLRAGMHPAGGGCLCLGGDCPHCLATVDGVSYVRTCQTAAKPGLVVERHHLQGYPPLPVGDQRGPAIEARNLHCDVVVIGTGESGRAAAAEAIDSGRAVIALDAADGQEAVGIYAGPLVVARTTEGMLHIHAREEVIVATGAAEIQPVAPGSHLAGLVTARAAGQLAQAGIDLGHVVAVGTPPDGIEAELAPGDLVRFEGDQRVEAVVVRDADGHEKRLACDTVSLGLGLHPRDTLRRMGHDLPVRAVGDAARESDIPPCPVA